jgi:hypothetical protein
MPPDVAAYKGIEPLTAPLLAWLRDHVPAPGGEAVTK